MSTIVRAAETWRTRCLCSVFHNFLALCLQLDPKLKISGSLNKCNLRQTIGIQAHYAKHMVDICV